MILDQERVKKWLIHFGLISNDQQWITAHVSGHGSTEQIQQIISESNPKNIIPIHTEHPEIFTENFKHVTLVNRGDEFIL